MIFKIQHLDPGTEHLVPFARGEAGKLVDGQHRRVEVGGVTVDLRRVAGTVYARLSGGELYGIYPQATYRDYSRRLLIVDSASGKIKKDIPVDPGTAVLMAPDGSTVVKLRLTGIGPIAGLLEITLERAGAKQILPPEEIPPLFYFRDLTDLDDFEFRFPVVHGDIQRFENIVHISADGRRVLWYSETRRAFVFARWDDSRREFDIAERDLLGPIYQEHAGQYGMQTEPLYFGINRFFFVGGFQFLSLSSSILYPPFGGRSGRFVCFDQWQVKKLTCILQMPACTIPTVAEAIPNPCEPGSEFYRFSFDYGSHVVLAEMDLETGQTTILYDQTEARTIIREFGLGFVTACGEGCLAMSGASAPISVLPGVFYDINGEKHMWEFRFPEIIPEYFGERVLCGTPVPGYLRDYVYRYPDPVRLFADGLEITLPGVTGFEVTGSLSMGMSVAYVNFKTAKTAYIAGAVSDIIIYDGQIVSGFSAAVDVSGQVLYYRGAGGQWRVITESSSSSLFVPMGFDFIGCDAKNGLEYFVGKTIISGLDKGPREVLAKYRVVVDESGNITGFEKIKPYYLSGPYSEVARYLVSGTVGVKFAP